MKKADIIKKARRIKAIVSDVDGVLTDGGIYYGPGGSEFKKFNIHDGLAVKLARSAGLKVFLVSGRSSPALRRRSRELGVDRLWQGSVDKGAIFNIIKEKFNVDPSEICYLGDDLPDIPPLLEAGIGVAVPNASEEVRKAASLITRRRGGEGALREIVEIILKSQRKWKNAIRPYKN